MRANQIPATVRAELDRILGKNDAVALDPNDPQAEHLAIEVNDIVTGGSATYVLDLAAVPAGMTGLQYAVLLALLLDEHAAVERGGKSTNPVLIGELDERIWRSRAKTYLDRPLDRDDPNTGSEEVIDEDIRIAHIVFGEYLNEFASELRTYVREVLDGERAE